MTAGRLIIDTGEPVMALGGFSGTDQIVIAYEFAGATRTVHMGTVGDSPSATWMGWSRGR